MYAARESESQCFIKTIQMALLMKTDWAAGDYSVVVSGPVSVHRWKQFLLLKLLWFNMNYPSITVPTCTVQYTHTHLYVQTQARTSISYREDAEKTMNWMETLGPAALTNNLLLYSYLELSGGPGNHYWVRWEFRKTFMGIKIIISNNNNCKTGWLLVKPLSSIFYFNTSFLWVWRGFGVLWLCRAK